MMFLCGTFGVRHNFILVWIWMFSVSSANDVIWSNNTSDTEGYFVNRTNIISVTIPSTRIPEHRKLQIELKNSTTASIAIFWKFFLDPSIRNDTFDGTRVECFFQNGKFISNMLPPRVNTYVFTNLEADTTYTICINAYERKYSGTVVYPTMQYSKCVILSTIPYLRRDSVIVLLCTMSYFLFFSLLGISQWRHKVLEIKKRYKNRGMTEGSGEEMQPIKRQENGQRLRCNYTSSAIEETIR